MAPQGFLGKFVGIVAALLHLCLCKGRILSHGILDGICHLRIIVVGTVYHFHAVADFAIATLHGIGPKSKTCQIGSDARHLEGDSLQRCISPRLIVRRINAEIIAQHHVIIGLVDNTVVPREIARQENELYLVFLAILHIEILQHAKHTVVTHIVEPMGNGGHFERSIIFLAALQTFLQVFAGFSHPSRHVNESHNVLFQLVTSQEPVHRLYVHIHTLVAELIAATGGNDERIVAKVRTRQRIGDIQQAHPCLLALLGKCSCLRNKTIVKAVGQHKVYRLVEQFLTLIGCYLAYRSEAVHIQCCLFLDGVFALHVELTGHLVAIVCKEIIVERLVISGNAPADTRGMSGKYGSHFRQVFLHIEQSQTCHPFVSMVQHLLAFFYDMLAEALHNKCCGIRKHGRFVIIAVSMQTVNAISFPSLAVDIILLIIIRCKVHKDRHRFARHIPSTHFNLQSILCSLFLPIGIKRIIT